MSVFCYVGTPGSGKSLHMARYIWQDLNRKPECLVLTNIPINTSSCKYPDRLKVFTNNQLGDAGLLIKEAEDYWSTHSAKSVDDAENRIHLYIDEAQILFNSRNWQQNSRKSDSWPWFFSVHRHYGFRVILCTQMLANLDKQVRGNVEYTIQHRKVTNFGFFGWLIGLFAKSMFVAIEIWQPIQQQLSSSFFVYRKKYGEIYDTHALFTSGDSAESLIKIESGDNKILPSLDGIVADQEGGGHENAEENDNFVASGNTSF